MKYKPKGFRFPKATQVINEMCKEWEESKGKKKVIKNSKISDAKKIYWAQKRTLKED